LITRKNVKYLLKKKSRQTILELHTFIKKEKGLLMDYLKKEFNKLLPFALLFGAIGGVLLIVAGNVFEATKISLAMAYLIVISLSVYSMNKMRYKREIGGTLLYGFMVYAVMTIIAYVDLVMNANPNFSNPLFEQSGFFGTIFIATFIISGIIVLLFRRRVIS